MRTYRIMELEKKHGLKYIDSRLLTYDEAFDLRNLNFVLIADAYITNHLTEYFVFVHKAKVLK